MIQTLVILGQDSVLGLYVDKYFATQTTLKTVAITESTYNPTRQDLSTLTEILAPHLTSTTLVLNTYSTIAKWSSFPEIQNLPYALNVMCSRYGSKFVHIVTDYQFPDTKTTHIETDLGTVRNYMYPIIRTSIIGEDPVSKTGLIEWAKRYICKEIDGWSNHYWNGITCLQFAKVIHEMIKQNIFWYGIRHIFSPRTITKYELLNIINDKFKLCIKVNNVFQSKLLDTRLATSHPENAKFDIPDIETQITNMYEFSPTLHNYTIPKVLYVYWDGNVMSQLQYLTVVTFQEHNPDWSVVLYMPIRRHLVTTWATSEQKTPYTGPNYFEQLLKLDIEVRSIDFERIGFRNDVPEVMKSDYIRCWLLGNYGGMWSDMDIIYIKPVDKLLGASSDVLGNVGKIDTVICYYSEPESVYPIGLLMSAPNNPFYHDICENALASLDLAEYQCVGCLLIKKLFPTPLDIKNKYPELNIQVLYRDSYLPYQWNQIDDIFVNSKPENIMPYTVGIHLFNGSDRTVYYENLFATNQNPHIRSIWPYIKKYMPDNMNIVDDVAKADLINDTIMVKSISVLRKQYFNNMYHENIRTEMNNNTDQPKSGTGSILSQTATIVREIPKLLKITNTKTFMDSPCGDFNWMQHAKLGTIKYIGANIVDDLIDKNNSLYKNEYREFLKRDIVIDDLPKVDVILCRDCLVHLPLDDIFAAIRNFIKSGSKYLLTTNFTKERPATNMEVPFTKYQWRPINLTISPFNFPKPLVVINEKCTEVDGQFDDKNLSLWKLDDLKQFVN